MSVLDHEDPLAALVGMDPPTQLADHLLPALRARGVAFDEAWDLALAVVQWPESRREERQWRDVFEDTRESWRAAYVGDPPERPEWVLRGLARVYDSIRSQQLAQAA